MTIKQTTKKLLLASPEARKYPKQLMIDFMESQGLVLTEEQKRIFRDMPDLWTVRRHAQKLVETGEVKLEDEVDQYRFKRYEEETAKHRADKPNYLERHGLVVVYE